MIRTRRWNDAPFNDDAGGEGTSILITRYRPRGVKKSDETWDEWVIDVAPSRELLADFHDGLSWADYRRRYLEEMRATRPDFFIRALRQRLQSGEAITLLCSSACTDEARCHRTVLAQLLEKQK